MKINVDFNLCCYVGRFIIEINDILANRSRSTNIQEYITIMQRKLILRFLMQGPWFHFFPRVFYQLFFTITRRNRIGHFRITLQCSQIKPSSRGQVRKNTVNVSEVSTWPRLEVFVCEQWSVIRNTHLYIDTHTAVYSSDDPHGCFSDI